MSSAAGPSGVDSIGPNQQFYSPPPSLNAVQSEELRRWAVEAALGQGIPTDYQQRGVDPASIQSRTRSFKRRHVPSWVLPGRPVVYVTNLRCTKRSFWRKQPYIRDLRIRANEHGPFEFATINPTNGAVTNVWWVGDVIDLITDGSSIFIALPGGFLRSRTFLEVKMASEEAAVALASDWGWEVDSGAGVDDGPANPPILTDEGEAFKFNH